MTVPTAWGRIPSPNAWRSRWTKLSNCWSRNHGRNHGYPEELPPRFEGSYPVPMIEYLLNFRSRIHDA